MKAKKLREYSVEELRELLLKTQQDLVKIRFQIAINKIKTNTDVPKNRKLIARIFTLLSEKEQTTDTNPASE